MSIAARLEDDHEVVTKLSPEHHDTPSSNPSSIFLTIPNSSHQTALYALFVGAHANCQVRPLTSPEPNRKCSNLPLGVAARSRRRRPAHEGRLLAAKAEGFCAPAPFSHCCMLSWSVELEGTVSVSK